MKTTNSIANLCDYQLNPNRIGGMDAFFWQFDAVCKKNNIAVDWFFPNESEIIPYQNLNIISSNNQAIESFFLQFCAVNSRRYDVVFCHFLELCTPFYYKVKQLFNCKIIAVDHNPRPMDGYSLKKQIEKKVKGFLFSKCIDQFVGVSKYTEKQICKDFGFFLKSKTITIYNGVLIENIKTQNHRNFDNPKFLVASHLRKSKGIQDLIDAVNMLADEIKAKLKIDIFGDGPYKEFLQQKVTNHNLNQQFNFVGNKPNLNEIYYRYDYMLQPTHMECFSLSILESLAANVPVVTTNVGGNEECVTHNFNGFIFEAKNKNQLKNILQNILNKKCQITENTRQLIENQFTIEQMVTNHFNLLK